MPRIHTGWYDDLVRDIKDRKEVQVKAFLVLVFAIVFAIFVIAQLSDLVYAAKHPIWVAENPTLLTEMDRPLFFPFIWLCPGPLNDDTSQLTGTDCTYNVVEGSTQRATSLRVEEESVEITNAEGFNVTHNCVVVDVMPGDQVTAAEPRDFIKCATRATAEIFVQFANVNRAEWFHWEALPNGADYAVGLTAVNYFSLRGLMGPFYRVKTLDTGNEVEGGMSLSFTVRFDTIGSESFIEIRNGSFLQMVATCGGMFGILYAMFFCCSEAVVRFGGLDTGYRVETYDQL